MKTLPQMITGFRNLKQGQRGITGLETAIVLIAFVVVSSVFAFAALSTGLFSSDKAKETIYAGLAEARGTLELRGSVIAEDTDNNGDLDKVFFPLAIAAGGVAFYRAHGHTLIPHSAARPSRKRTTARRAPPPGGAASMHSPLPSGSRLTGLSTLRALGVMITGRSLSNTTCESPHRPR